MKVVLATKDINVVSDDRVGSHKACARYGVGGGN